MKKMNNEIQLLNNKHKHQDCKLKSSDASSENSLKIHNKVINEFVNEADIPKGDFIDLLINKNDRN
jgi:hypothetical protein